MLIVDECSSDQTSIKAEEYQRKNGRENLTILYNTVNQGYGGNQKLDFIMLFRTVLMAFVVRAKPTLDHRLERAVKAREIKIAQHS